MLDPGVRVPAVAFPVVNGIVGDRGADDLEFAVTVEIEGVDVGVEVAVVVNEVWREDQLPRRRVRRCCGLLERLPFELPVCRAFRACRASLKPSARPLPPRIVRRTNYPRYLGKSYV